MKFLVFKCISQFDVYVRQKIGIFNRRDLGGGCISPLQRNISKTVGWEFLHFVQIFMVPNE